MRILAIDPGNEKTAWAMLEKNNKLEKGWKVCYFAKEENAKFESRIRLLLSKKEQVANVAIEMIGHYGTGMPAGKTVFDTCVEIGRIQILCESNGWKVSTIKRPTIKTYLCGTPRAKDGNVIQALKDRFGDKGTKSNPGFFYGVSADCWQAIACGIAWYETEVRK